MQPEGHTRPGDVRALSIGSILGTALKFGTSIIPGGSIVETGIRTASSLVTGSSGDREAEKERAKAAKLNLPAGRQRETGAKGIPLTVGTIPFTLPGSGNGNGSGACPPPLKRSPQGNCVAPTSPRGAELFMGEPIAGRFGVGVIAASKIVDVAQCPKKMVLGADGICYNKEGFNNKNRMWPKGRAPLLTGGDMNAITIANRSARRLEATTKRLQRMGMMKKPTTRRAPAGHTAKLSH